MNLHTNLDLTRERSGLTQSDLAIQLGMTRSGVNAWEMGISKPSLENLVILSRILHTTTDYLLGNNNEETIVINDFTPEEKEMVMRMVHYIEEMHQLKCKKTALPSNRGAVSFLDQESFFALSII